MSGTSVITNGVSPLNRSIELRAKIAIREVIKSRHTSQRLGEKLIVVPIGQLFIKALKGENMLPENFKHKYHGMDLLKVNEEVRVAPLENLKKAARLVADNPVLDDPDTDKKVIVKGTSNITVTD